MRRSTAVMTIATLLAGSLLATADLVGAQDPVIRTAVWVENPDTGEIAFVPASNWYPNDAGVLITVDGRVGISTYRPDGYDPTGPSEDSTFNWASDDGGHDAVEGDVFIASGIDTEGESFEFRYIHEEQTGPFVPASDWSTHPDHLRPPAYVHIPGAAPALISPFAPPTSSTAPAPANGSTVAAAPTTDSSATTAAPSATVPETAAPTPTAAPTTTAAPVTSSFEGDRPVVVANANTVLDQPNTIYDFQDSSPGEVVILASNVEARNIRGGGARRIGERNGVSISDSGFRNFQFTFAHIQMSGGATITRPYFINGTDVNGQPHVGEGDILQVFAYQGDIVSPLIDNVTIYGKQRPSGSDSHNDGIQFTGIDNGRVLNPTVRNSYVEGASSAGIQAKHVHGTFTIENNRLSERFESFHAVIAKPGDGSSTMLWRNNTMINGASAALTDGWSAHPSSDGSADIS